MATTHTKFDGAIPEIYDTHLGPLLFHYYAVDLAGRIDVAAGGQVLETACGTGIATEKLRDALDDDIEIVATDLNDAMLAIASQKKTGRSGQRHVPAGRRPQPALRGREFRCRRLPVRHYFYPNKDAGAREAMRLLKPGGTFAFNLWGSFDANPAMRIAHETISGFFESNPPTFLELHFGYYHIDPIKTLLRDTGFEAINIETVDTVVERPSAHHVAVGTVTGNLGIFEIDERATAGREDVVEAVTQALRDNFGHAPMRAPVQAIVATAQKPKS